MKKSSLIICVLAVASMISCGTSPKKPTFNTPVDTVSYTIGMVRTQGFVNYLTQQMGVDTTYMKDFVKGFLKGASMDDDEATKAYLAGLQIGQQELSQAVTTLSKEMFGEDSDAKINSNNYALGFIAGTNQDFSVMSMDRAMELADSLYTLYITKTAETKYADNKAAGQEYLAKKATEEGVIATGSGLLYKVIEAGKGAIPGPTDVVKVSYKGSLIDGTIFDQSSSPIELPVNGVISGWTEALQIMPVGSKWELYIPYNLAYGEQEKSVIKPYSALIFEVELVSIEKK